MTTAAIIWLSLAGVFVVVEAACPFHLVSVWFAVGALVAAIVGQLGGAVWLQTLLFFGVSIGLMAVLWRYIKKFMTSKVTKTNVDSVIGSQGYVTAPVDNLNATGQVKLGGMYWTARSTDGKPISEGTLVQVDRIEGVKVFVTVVKEEISV
ncbi:MAG: NfeD family protein [Oscillospiraceae bacterium]|nr:NfeD family protein [Oscillospiraceae bacterium]